MKKQKDTELAKSRAVSMAHFQPLWATTAVQYTPPLLH